jgi:hypothetical protein
VGSIGKVEVLSDLAGIRDRASSPFAAWGKSDAL